MRWPVEASREKLWGSKALYGRYSVSPRPWPFVSGPVTYLPSATVPGSEIWRRNELLHVNEGGACVEVLVTVIVVVVVLAEAVWVARLVMVAVCDTAVASRLQAEATMLAGYLVRTAGVESVTEADRFCTTVLLAFAALRDDSAEATATEYRGTVGKVILAGMDVDAEPSSRLSLAAAVMVVAAVTVAVTVEIGVVVVVACTVVVAVE